MLLFVILWGLVAESDTIYGIINLLGHRNVVLAGQKVKQFVQEGLINISRIVIYLEEQSFSMWKDTDVLKLIRIRDLLNTGLFTD
jgi:hypothetical protein